MSIDDVLVKHLQTLGKQPNWHVYELPETITVEVLHVLGDRGWIEIRRWHGKPSRPTRTILPAEYDEWIRPVGYPSDRPETPQLTSFHGELVEVGITEQGATKLCEAAVLTVVSKAESPKLTEKPGEQQPEAEPARHSIDFRFVHWYGRDHTFSAKQASCIRVLWEARENQTPEVGDGTILEKAGAGDRQRLRDVFKNHLAWGTMIRQGSHQDTHKLSELPAKI